MDPQLLGLRTVIYPSPDLDAAKRWWTDFLGVAPYFDQPFYVGFDVAGYELGLVPDGDLSREATTYWGVGDVATCVERATALGAEVLEAPLDVGEGIVVGAVRNPSGSVVGFIVNPHFAARD